MHQSINWVARSQYEWLACNNGIGAFHQKFPPPPPLLHPMNCFLDTTHILAGATHCNTLQHTATHCNTLQHTAVCGLSQYELFPWHRGYLSLAVILGYHSLALILGNLSLAVILGTASERGRESVRGFFERGDKSVWEKECVRRERRRETKTLWGGYK